ncbi:MAG: response regulator [Oscillospiraceae bacterium]|jgi:putative two-component system response regulator|nr:response regulator [Oscillospiraceae bacterium]
MKTIFAVDDNRANLVMAEQALSGHYEVITILSADIMFKMLNDVIPDLILLDIMMPEINGFEALERLKADAKFADIPVIFLTGNRNTSIEAQGFALGAVDIVYKPFSAPSLLSRIKAHIRKGKDDD